MFFSHFLSVNVRAVRAVRAVRGYNISFSRMDGNYLSGRLGRRYEY